MVCLHLGLISVSYHGKTVLRHGLFPYINIYPYFYICFLHCMGVQYTFFKWRHGCRVQLYENAQVAANFASCI
jgi:hypothetical protein